MQGVTCPYCGETMYSASWQPGKQKCIYCSRRFSITYDQLKQATNPNSPVQGQKEE